MEDLDEEEAVQCGAGGKVLTRTEVGVPAAEVIRKAGTTSGRSIDSEPIVSDH
jgi:hypothetical protein